MNFNLLYTRTLPIVRLMNIIRDYKKMGVCKMDDKMNNTKGHNIIMRDRQGLSITGVVDVLSFDEENVDIETEMGMLAIKGTDLQVNKLNLEKGELEVEGEIESLAYSDGELFSKKGTSILGKLFK